jgi:hypothetical protein
MESMDPSMPSPGRDTSSVDFLGAVSESSSSRLGEPSASRVLDIV